MKIKFLLLYVLIVFSCKEKQNHWAKYVINDKIALDDYWRKVTGYDSLQITADYEGAKLRYNFCYPNKWEFEKFKKDTVFIHDTIVKKIHKYNGVNIKTVNQTGGQAAETIINNQ